jgi:hypothetical protein
MLLLSFFISLTLFSQAPRGANLIIIKNINYDELLNALLDKGYFIAKKDAALGIASTERRQVSKADPSSSYLIRVRVKDSVAYISGEVNIDYATIKDERFAPAQNKGLKWNAQRLAFEKMEDFAGSLGREISYSTQ